jgi:hypothetical protein
LIREKNKRFYERTINFFYLKGEKTMEPNEIMVTEEVGGAIEAVETTGSEKVFKIAAAIGVVALVGGIAYKCIVKPIMAKVKANKNRRDTGGNSVDFERVTDVEESGENE